MFLSEGDLDRFSINRRRMLQLMAAAAAAALHPRLLARAGAAGPAGHAPYGFLTAEELRILDAATAAILPSNGGTGAREVGVVGYVQNMLSFLPGADANCDRQVNVADVTAVEQKVLGQYLGCPEGGDVDGNDAIDRDDLGAAEAAAFRARPMFAGGPFSGRHPQPHFPVGQTPCSVCHGAHDGRAAGAGAAAGPGQVLLYPPAAFREFTPMNRLQQLSWKLRLLGPESVPEVAGNAELAAFNEELPETDLRRRYRRGLAELETISLAPPFGTRFADLPPAQQEQVLRRADPAFVDLLHRHVLQGTLCAPEYGGNQNQLGWQLAGFDGDSQPLGYEIYDASIPGYRERPDKPNRGPNPDEDCGGFSPDMRRFLDFISRVTGGGPFPAPYCFEVG